MKTIHLRLTGRTKQSVCECDECSAEGLVFEVVGERDSFGTEYLHWCADCVQRVDAEVGKAREEEEAELVKTTEGPDDADYYVSVLGNRDTVDECAIVRTKAAAVAAFLRWKRTCEDRGDYVYAEALRVAGPNERAAAKEHANERAGFDDACMQDDDEDDIAVSEYDNMSFR